MIALTPSSVDSVVGTVAYPSLNCGGELTLRRLNSDSIELFENLTYGTQRCINRGTVKLKFVSSRRLNFSWFTPGGSQDAEGIIQKISNN